MINKIDLAKQGYSDYEFSQHVTEKEVVNVINNYDNIYGEGNLKKYYQSYEKSDVKIMKGYAVPIWWISDTNYTPLTHFESFDSKNNSFRKYNKMTHNEYNYYNQYSDTHSNTTKDNFMTRTAPTITNITNITNITKLPNTEPKIQKETIKEEREENIGWNDYGKGDYQVDGGDYSDNENDTAGGDYEIDGGDY
eukprot:CAMPEP_0170517176 /NCGR_PEP_ID=MMETSP0209-20121228/3231_1 /TAXON_ID=665100 ORGANISM="Litonotus pictus, Strain P1" /NCGR_SAMPLE_ID=MMETSP0209 /ASSEMBLY_ACC=CAM_ASM_000301 /LENGTH=193 /DNA_ID=CAMNT_0010802343 /DNA_START=1007 /DNA_END=1588 /DNA_ORIENTATION=-